MRPHGFTVQCCRLVVLAQKGDQSSGAAAIGPLHEAG